jgi:hypothetical protein
LGDLRVQRDRPLLGIPVIGGFRVDRERGCRACGEGKKRLEERGVDFVAIIIPSERPDVIRKDAVTAAASLHDRFTCQCRRAIVNS